MVVVAVVAVAAVVDVAVEEAAAAQLHRAWEAVEEGSSLAIAAPKSGAVRSGRQRTAPRIRSWPPRRHIGLVQR